MDADPAALEKFNRYLPPTVREIFLILIAVTATLFGGPKTAILTPLFTALALLTVTALTTKKPKPKKTIFWQWLRVTAETLKPLLPPNTFSFENFKTSKYGVCKLEITEANKSSFYSSLFYRSFYAGGGAPDSFPIQAYITEVQEGALQDQHWKGTLYRVGRYITPDGKNFLWFTANLEKFLKENPLPKNVEVSTVEQTE